MQWSMDELTCHAPILPCGQHDQHRVVEAPYDNRKLPLTLYGADRASGTAASRGGGAITTTKPPRAQQIMSVIRSISACLRTVLQHARSTYEGPVRFLATGCPIRGYTPMCLRSDADDNFAPGAASPVRAPEERLRLTYG